MNDMRPESGMGLVVRLGRFGFVGVVATIVHVCVGLGMHHLAGASPLWANGIAFSVAVVVNFIGQTRLTFPEAAADGAAFLRFLAAALIGFGLNQAIVWVVTGPAGGAYWLALLVVVCSVPAFTFCVLRYWALR